MARSSVLGWLVTHASRLPVIGETVMRMRNFLIMRSVFRGGVADGESIRPRSSRKCAWWAIARALPRVPQPAAQLGELGASDRGLPLDREPRLLVWGAQDWARPSEREHDRTLIPPADMTTIEHGGHFLPLDRPQELTREIRRFRSDPSERHDPFTSTGDGSMRKLILQEFVSLDGLAAGPSDSVAFVPTSTQGDQSFGREQLALMDAIDALLLGGVTYRMFAGFWPNVTEGEEKPFADKLNATPKVVFSKTLERASWGLGTKPGSSKAARWTRSPG